MNQTLCSFTAVIRQLTSSELAGGPTLTEKLRLAHDGPVEVLYAPFEYINPHARVVIVGITPGRTQMLNALRECKQQLDAGASAEEALKSAKQTGAFSGAMRPNLIALMDAIGLQRWLGISSCEALFDQECHLIQTTSVLRNPTFVNGKNYNGAPDMTRHPLLHEQLVNGFGQDLRALPDAIFIPLGDKVSQALTHLVGMGLIDPARILIGLPHPSGANAERIAYFLGKKNKSSLSAKTNPAKLDAARIYLIKQIAKL
jgi:hypothetical protein